MHPPRPPIPVSEADPLGAYQAGAVERRSGRPIPLAATRIRVLLEGGLVVVRTERIFRNAEAVSIEATLTFPVPVHATLFGLATRIDGRLLRGVAQRRDAARTSYEAAVDRGHSAVLHEELLRGVHMLSLAHAPPGGGGGRRLRLGDAAGRRRRRRGAAAHPGYGRRHLWLLAAGRKRRPADR
jgi:hypothetical protein